MTRVLIDTSILCSALWSDDNGSLSSAVLQDALLGPDLAFQPVLAESVLFEFMLKCREGFGGKRFSQEDLETFFSRFERLWRRPNRVAIQTARVYWRNKGNQPVGHLLLHVLQGRRPEEIRRMQEALDEYGIRWEMPMDPGDFHVLLSALLYRCSVIVTW